MLGTTASRYRVSFWDDENVVKLDCNCGCRNVGVF